MTMNIGLRLAVTTCAVFGILILPQHTTTISAKIRGLLAAWVLSVRVAKGQTIRLRISRVINKALCVFRKRKTILDLPGEVRNHIYGWVCVPDNQGSVKGAIHILHINRQIRHEALPYFESIAHVIKISDLYKIERDTAAYLGQPYLLREEEKLTWDLSRLRHLVLEVRVLSIGDMTPDCFDVMISANAKHQWRGLKQLIGIWPKTRETPLESIRLDLKPSECGSKDYSYRADLIRIIRNFKRTRIWAETGDCSQRKGNKSLLLPLVRAFNQGRRNWVEESSEDHNLIVRFDAQYLKNRNAGAEDTASDKERTASFEADKARWSVVPVNDTTRSESSHWPEWTGKEATYISEKMIRKEMHELDRELTCRECLASFLRPGHLRDHVRRGLVRTASESAVEAKKP